MTQPHVLIVEPFPYHANFTLTVCEGFVAQGAQVTMVTTPMGARHSMPGVSVLPTWPEQPKPLSAPRSAVARMPHMLRSLKRFFTHSSEARRALAHALGSLSPTHVVMATSDPMDLHAAAMLEIRIPFLALVHDPPRGQSSQLAIRKVESSTNTLLQIGVLTSRMRELFIEAGSSDARIVRVPNPAFTTSQHVVERTPNAKAPVTYLGNARLEKGFDLFVESIPSLLEQGFRVVVQRYLRGDEGDLIHAAAGRIDKIQSAQLHVIDGPMTDDQYAQALSDALAVVLPYRAQDYGLGRISGILPEAWSAGTPVIVTDGWWGADQVRQYGGGLVYDPRDSRSLVEAAESIASDIARCSEAASAASAAASKVEGVAAFSRWVLSRTP